MQKILLTSLAALSLSLGTVAYSQDTSTTTEAATTETTATEAPASAEDQTFPVAKDESPENQIGKDFIKEEFDDWKILCTVVAEGKNANCRLYQVLKDGNGGAVAELSILALSEKAQAVAGVNFVSPLGTLLTAQVGMRVDAGKVKRYPFSWCEPQGCVTRFGLTKPELDNLKKGNKAVMTIVAAAAPKNPLALNVPLKGFTAAWNALKDLSTKKEAPKAD